MSVELPTNQIMPIIVKIVMIGLSSVGKTSLLLRFTDHQWLPEHAVVATVGVDTWSDKLDVKGKRVNLTIWDTPGEERFRAITSSYYRGTQGILLVYDITDRESYEAIPLWFAERGKDVPESTVKIMVGNKADKEHARQVSTEEAEAYAARMGCLFVETSAKTATGVSRAFRDVVERVAETPELWVVQEPRKASQASNPELPNPSLSEQVVPAPTQVEGNRRVIGGFLLTQNTIQFGGHYYDS